MKKSIAFADENQSESLSAVFDFFTANRQWNSIGCDSTGSTQAEQGILLMGRTPFISSDLFPKFM
jgi:hypothetical protein